MTKHPLSSVLPLLSAREGSSGATTDEHTYCEGLRGWLS